MCHWHADSTFEVLAEIGKAKVCADANALRDKGVFRWSRLECVAYSGVTRKALAETGDVDTGPTHAGDDGLYQQQLVKMQGELIAKYDCNPKKAWSEEDLARLPAVERQAVERNGWNVAQFLSMIQDMPTHQELLDDSIAREREVREALEKVCYTISICGLCYTNLGFRIDSERPGGRRSRGETRSGSQRVRRDGASYGRARGKVEERNIRH